jgi:hypothetical protein
MQLRKCEKPGGMGIELDASDSGLCQLSLSTGKKKPKKCNKGNI